MSETGRTSNVGGKVVTLWDPFAGSEPAAGRLRVLVVDAHPLFRQGVVQTIGHDPRFEVIAHTGSPIETRTIIERERPEVVTLCLQLGATDGLELIKQLKAISPDLRILIISSLDEQVWATRALMAGADGFVMKSAEPATAMQSLAAVACGETWVSPRMASRIVRQACGREKRGAGTLDILSDRELHVFKLIGSGLGTRQIAESLHLSVKTIETYRANIRLKLGLRDAFETVACARRWMGMGQPMPDAPPL